MVWKITLDTLKRRFGWRRSANWLLTDRTQLDKPSADRVIQLYLGLDFGTAFTKVVVGEQTVRYAVPFNEFGDHHNTYLLPSRLTLLSEDEVFTLGDVNGAKESLVDIKMRLINRDFGEETQVYVVAFLALVMRYVRGWFLETHRRTYAGSELRWLVNVGMPTESYHDEEMKTQYQKLTQLAWAASVLPGPITANSVSSFVRKGTVTKDDVPSVYAERLLESDLVASFPEFAVQLNGYVRSPRVQLGLHVLLDVGAGTLDMAIFNVWKNHDGDFVFPIFEKGVKPYGTQELLRQRARAAGLSLMDGVSPFENVPSVEELASKWGATVEQIRQGDDAFSNDVGGFVSGKLNTARHQQVTNRHDWEHGVVAFYCGGGAHVDTCRSVFHRYENAHPPHLLNRRTLEIPDDLEARDLTRGTYDRLSVAYGLAFDPFDIAEVRRSDSIEPPGPPDSPSASRYTDAYIDQSML